MQDLQHALGIADKARRILGDFDIEGEIALGYPLAQRLARFLHDADDIDLDQFQFHGTGIDRRQIENGVDDDKEVLR